MGVIYRNGIPYGDGGTSLIADYYSSDSTYAVGDIVIYQGKLYKCNIAIVTPEAFNSTKWDVTRVAEELEDKIDISNLVSVTNTGDVYIGQQLIRKVLTQNEYDALTTKDPKVDYCIIEATS